MLSKSHPRARWAWAALLLLSGCRSLLPWEGAPPPDEVNAAFALEQNLIVLPSAQMNGVAGRYIFGSATPHSVVDSGAVRLAGASRFTTTFGERWTRSVTPVTADLHRVADAVVGVDAISPFGVTIDYHAGLLTIQKNGIHTDGMTRFHFRGEPVVPIEVDGRTLESVIDTTSPDTLTLPAQSPRRGTAAIVLAGVDFGRVDVGYANVARPRIGNRILSRFLVEIDYGHGVVGLWPDPRNH